MWINNDDGSEVEKIDIIAWNNDSFWNQTHSVFGWISDKINNIVWSNQEWKHEQISRESLFKQMKELSALSDNKDFIALIDDLIDNYLNYYNWTTPDDLYNSWVLLSMDISEGIYNSGANKGGSVSDKIWSIKKEKLGSLENNFIELLEVMFGKEVIELSSFFSAKNMLNISKRKNSDIEYVLDNVLADADEYLWQNQKLQQKPDYYLRDRARKHLLEMSSKYSIKKIIWNKSISGIFMGSPVWEWWVEGMLEDILKKSLEKWEWVWIETNLEDRHFNELAKNRGLNNAINLELVAFYFEEVNQKELEFLKYCDNKTGEVLYSAEELSKMMELDIVELQKIWRNYIVDKGSFWKERLKIMPTENFINYISDKLNF